MRIDILSLFPEMFTGVFGQSIIKRAAAQGLIDINQVNIRDYAIDKHRSVDDKPYGGGPGMVMMCGPVFDAVEATIQGDAAPVDEIILMTPQGQPFNQRTAEKLAQCNRLMIIAGHYEGFDERIRCGLATREISIGDYVLSGGELPAMVVVDALVRLLPGALGDQQSTEEESFSAENGLLEYPQYTRPPEFRGMEVPEILLGGHHEKIRQWRLQQALARTQQKRPDLLTRTNEVGSPEAKS